MEIKVIEKRVCGKSRYYPDCELSRAILGIARHKAFLKDDLEALRDGGLSFLETDRDGNMWRYPARK